MTRPSLIATFLASGYFGSSVVMRPLCRMRSGLDFAFMDCGLCLGLRLKPAVQKARDDGHHDPGQQRDDGGVEDGVAWDERPFANSRAEGQIQNHRQREDTEERGHGHFPFGRRVVRGTKPRFESMQRTLRPRSAFRQRRAFLLPGLEDGRKSTRLNSSHLVISYAVFCLTQ